MAKCEILSRNIAKYEEEHVSLERILTRNGIEIPTKIR
jgi:hypothetical protein